MAFSKAKILRFNDIKSCAPAPGAYNPKYDEHVTGIVSYAKEKTTEPCSPASSCSDVKSTKSTNSTFRTPTIPRRRKPIPHSTGKLISSIKLFSPQRSEALREKIVECNNKDETIRDIQSQLEELKSIINQLRIEKDNLTSEKDELLLKYKQLTIEFEEQLRELQENYNTEITTINTQLADSLLENKNINEDFNQIKAELKAKNQSEIKQLQENLDVFESCLKKELSDTENLLKDTNEKLKDKEITCCNLQSDLIKKCEQIRELEQRYNESLQMQVDLQKRYATEMDIALRLHQTETEDLEYEMLKLVTEYQRTIDQIQTEQKKVINEMELNKSEEMSILKEHYTLRLDSMRDESEAKIRQFEENCLDKIKLAEIQMEETRKSIELNWVLKLQEQAQQSEDILKECQAISEFTVIQTEIEKNQIKLDLHETEQFVVDLTTEKQRLSNENIQLGTAVANLKTQLSNLIIELNDAREALGKEIENRENDLDCALKEKHSYQVTLHKTHETVNALKNRLLNSDRDVEQLKVELNNLEQSKLEEYIDLKEQLQAAQSANLELVEENFGLKSIDNHVRTLEITLLERVDDLRLKSQEERIKLTQIIEDKQQLLNELHFYITNQQKLHAEAQILINDSKIEIEHLESENVDLKFKVSRLESTITHMNTAQVSLNKKENDANEVKNIYRKYIDQSGKFDELQQQYEEMKLRNLDLEQIVKTENEAMLHQARTIEKLKQELAHSNKLNRKSRQIADKENTPTKTITNNRVDSPGKALKERN